MGYWSHLRCVEVWCCLQPLPAPGPVSCRRPRGKEVGLVSISSGRFYAPKLRSVCLHDESMSVSAGGAGLEDVDPDLHAARTELMLSDQERTPVELAVGVHAASAAAMQNQHMADDVNAAARRAYLGITDDVSAKLTPFEQYVVVDVLTQVARCTPRPACSQPASRLHPAAAACRLSRERATSSRSR